MACRPSHLGLAPPDVNYNKSEILEYQQKVWLKSIIIRYTQQKSTVTNETVSETAQMILHSNIVLNKNNNIFNYNTSKREDSFIMDYLHGNSLLFGNTRASIIDDTNENKCYFCDNWGDSPYHQLIACEAVKDESHQAFQDELDKCLARCENEPLSHVPKLLASENIHQLQKRFIERVKFLKEKHDIFEQLQGNESTHQI